MTTFTTSDEFAEKMTRIRALRALADALADCRGPLPYEVDRGELAFQVRNALHRVVLVQSLADHGFTFGPFEAYRSDPRHGKVQAFRGGLPVVHLYGAADVFALTDQATHALLDAIRGDAVEWVREPPEDEPPAPLPGDDEDDPVEFDDPPTVRRWQAHPLGGNREYVSPA